MALFGRIIVILFALFLATAAGGIAAAIALFGAELRMVGADPVEHVLVLGHCGYLPPASPFSSASCRF